MTSKKPKGAVKFHQDWDLKYALQISTRDPVTKDVSSVVCLMCTNFGRDNDDEADRKRKRTSNDKYFTAPWRTDSFVSHLRKQHAASMWDNYKKLSSAEKRCYFAATESPERVNLRSFVQPEASVKAQIIAKQKCSYVIDGNIVSKIIMDLLLMPFEEGGQDVLDDDKEEQEESASASGAAVLPEGGDGNGSNEETADMTELYATMEK